jgi:hypothetical protein
MTARLKPYVSFAILFVKEKKSGLGLALFGDVLVFRMRRRLLAFGLSATILDFLWIGGEDGSQSLRELVALRR